MQSQVVKNVVHDAQERLRYSELCVMKSAAGYYIGTWYKNGDGFEEPGSRDRMEYFSTSHEAQEALDSGNWTQREHP